MGLLQDLLYPFRRPAAPAPRAPTGFFTDTTLCIGCKACEVACKQWNQLPSDGFHFSGDSYDNTRMLSATTWRHVTFVEQFPAPAAHPPAPAAANSETAPSEGPAGRWLMMSDVCKHCSAAPCAIACPTGALIVNEFSNVYVQNDICNGCGSLAVRSTVTRTNPPCATTASATTWSSVRQGVPDQIDSVRTHRRTRSM